MDNQKSVIPVEERIENVILFMRDEKVIIDADLARLYGVTTKRLNEQIKRNRDRFPPDFMFQLTAEEKAEVVAKCDHLSVLKFSKGRPFAFTEHGAIMAASVLSTPRAVATSILVVRIFIKLRRMLSANADINRKLEALEKKYDRQFRVVFDAIRALMAEPENTKRKIGFTAKESSTAYTVKKQKRAQGHPAP